MHQASKQKKKEGGFILVMVLMIMTLLSFYGLSYIHSSSTEILIAGSDKFHESAFYSSESGLQVGMGWLDTRAILPIEPVGLDTTNPVISLTQAKFANPDSVVLPGSDTGFTVTADFNGAIIMPGWDASQYKRYEYQIFATGTGLGGAESVNEAQAGKVVNVGAY